MKYEFSILEKMSTIKSKKLMKDTISLKLDNNILNIIINILHYFNIIT